MNNMGPKEKEIVEAFDQAHNEREVQPFLKKRPLIVRNALNVWAWNHVEVIPEFQFGSEHRADFLILSADSGSWHAVFVELKSHRARLFTKAGVPTRSLSIALRQLDDWERWVNRYNNLLRDTLSRYLKAKNIPAYCSNPDNHTMAATEITDSKTNLDTYFRVLIGRRAPLTTEDQERRASYSKKDREIVTYDRLLDVARKLDCAGA